SPPRHGRAAPASASRAAGPWSQGSSSPLESTLEAGRLDRSPAPGYSHPSMSSRRARSQATRSPRSTKTDADPILSAIVRPAARLCDASYCHLYLVDGGFLRNVANHGWLAPPPPVPPGFPLAP